MDIAEEMLAGQAAAVRRDFPDLRVIPVAADFSGDFAFPAFDFDRDTIAVFYAGSSLGNFEPEQASAFLARLARAAGPGSRPPARRGPRRTRRPSTAPTTIPGGLNAAFNRNILNNVNRLKAALRPAGIVVGAVEGRLVLLGPRRSRRRDPGPRRTRRPSTAPTNDPGGLNAAFNRNILNNVNRLADGDFDPEKWIPHQFYGRRARAH